MKCKLHNCEMECPRCRQARLRREYPATDKQREAARQNGKLGGRPKKEKQA